MLAAYLIEIAALEDPEGKLDPLDFPNFDKYWLEDHRSPWWIMDGDKAAGLALVGKFSWSKQPVDQGLIEYYIAPSRRRGGIGAEAARSLFASMPGQWELATGHRNPGAQAFWRRTIGEGGYADWRTIEREDDLLHRFVVAPS